MWPLNFSFLDTHLWRIYRHKCEDSLPATSTMATTLRVVDKCFAFVAIVAVAGRNPRAASIPIGPYGPNRNTVLGGSLLAPGANNSAAKNSPHLWPHGRQCRLRRIAAQKRPKCGGLVVSPPVRGHCRHICGRFVRPQILPPAILAGWPCRQRVCGHRATSWRQCLRHCRPVAAGGGR